MQFLQRPILYLYEYLSAIYVGRAHNCKIQIKFRLVLFLSKTHIMNIILIFIVLSLLLCKFHFLHKKEKKMLNFSFYFVCLILFLNPFFYVLLSTSILNSSLSVNFLSFLLSSFSWPDKVIEILYLKIFRGFFLLSFVVVVYFFRHSFVWFAWYSWECWHWK